MNFQMFQMDLEKAEEPDIKLPTLVWSSKKHKSSRKISISALLTTTKPFWITTNYGKFLERWEYQTTSPASWENLYAGQEAIVGKGHGKRDWFKTGKEYIKAVYSHWYNLYAEYMMQNARLHESKLETRLPGEILITSDMQMTPPLQQKVKRN